MIFGQVPKSVYIGSGKFSATGYYIEHFTSQEDEYGTLPSTLQEVLANANESGVYRMWSSFSNKPVKVFVHKEADGKKWALVLRYNHQAGTNPDVNYIKQGDFPIPPDITKLTSFNDESNTNGWGHLTPSYLSQLNISQVAFFGITSAHDRTVCFTLSKEGAGYVQGKGFFRYDLVEPYSMFNYHASANLPTTANLCTMNALKGLTETPFARYGDAYWSIGVDGLRWEVDNCLDPRILENVGIYHKNYVNAEQTHTEHIVDVEEEQIYPRKLKAVEEEQMYNFDTLHMVFVR